MKASLHRRDTSIARKLDKELTNSVTTALLVFSKITEADLEAIRSPKELPLIPKREQRDLRSKLAKVRELDSDFRSLSNLLKDHNLLIRFELMDLTTSPPPLPHIPQQDKKKEITVGTNKALGQKRKAQLSEEGLMKDARKISSCRNELDHTMIKILSALPTMAAASVHMYWTSTWEKANEKASMGELLKLVEMTIARGLILNKEVYITLAGFEDKLGKEKAKSKKYAVDLKVMSF
ncbi:hypothetical protein Adt_11375 [Abeliophyllum distichum]|uniref:Uncharacterized protein n=1 Tax=Abeliophyllum distichum TaxID=126358 RepID=A0ABD1UMP1_9LAMI